MTDWKYLDVYFKTKISRSESCICDGCHRTGCVMKIKLPETKFFNGKDLATRYENYWLCARCRTKLSHALNWPGEETNER